MGSPIMKQFPYDIPKLVQIVLKVEAEFVCYSEFVSSEKLNHDGSEMWRERDYQLVESFVPVSILYYLIFHKTGKEITRLDSNYIYIYIYAPKLL